MSIVMITGGYGFIGSNLVQQWLKRNPKDTIINMDCATYAARPKYLDTFLKHHGYKHKSAFIADFDHIWSDVDIRDGYAVEQAFLRYQPDHVIHLAAESHVCRSINGPGDFMHTNIIGTFNLLESFRRTWGNSKQHRFHHVSTDEVYGSLSKSAARSKESDGYVPTSPYASSKASSNHIVQSYAHTYGLNVTTTCSSNNFGPNQHEEKLIPKTIRSLLKDEPIQVYGPGTQIRDWIYVEDHCDAIMASFALGKAGETFNVGGNMELTNLQVIDEVVRAICVVTGKPQKYYTQHVDARPTDDLRYALDNSKMKSLGWRPSKNRFHENLVKTVKWYMENKND